MDIPFSEKIVKKQTEYGRKYNPGPLLLSQKGACRRKGRCQSARGQGSQSTWQFLPGNSGSRFCTRLYGPETVKDSPL